MLFRAETISQEDQEVLVAPRGSSCTDQRKRSSQSMEHYNATLTSDSFVAAREKLDAQTNNSRTNRRYKSSAGLRPSLYYITLYFTNSLIMRLAGPLLVQFYITNVIVAVSSSTKSDNAPTTSNDISSALNVAFSAGKGQNGLNDFNSSISAYLNQSTIKVECFTQPAPPAFPLRGPVVMADYCKALQQIILLPDFLETRIWELGPDPDTWLGWKSHNSGIFLGGQISTVEAFAPAFVVHVAAVIAAECLDITKGYLGGRANAGPGGNIFVAVGALNVRPPSTNAVER